MHIFFFSSPLSKKNCWNEKLLTLVIVCKCIITKWGRKEFFKVLERIMEKGLNMQGMLWFLYTKRVVKADYSFFCCLLQLSHSVCVWVVESFQFFGLHLLVIVRWFVQVKHTCDYNNTCLLLLSFIHKREFQLFLSVSQRRQAILESEQQKCQGTYITN